MTDKEFSTIAHYSLLIANLYLFRRFFMEKEEEKLPLKEVMRLLFKASKGFWLVNIVNFGDGIAYFGMLNLMTLFLGTSLGMPDAMSGWTVSLLTGLVTLFMFGGGFVSDKLGVRRALTFCLALLLGGRLLLNCTSYIPHSGDSWMQPAYLLCWVAIIVIAFAEGVIQPALYAGVKEYTDERTATMSYSFLYAIMNLGIMTESFISPFIRSEEEFMKVGKKSIMGLGWGFEGVFWVCIAATAIMFLINVLVFTKKVEERDRQIPAADAAADGQEEAAPKTLGEKIKSMMIFDGRFFFFIFALLPVRTLFAHQWLTIPDYIMRCFPAEVGAKYEWFSALNPFIIVIFVPLIAAFTRRVNVITMMIIGTLISAMTTFILVPGPHVGTLIAYIIMFSLGEAVWSSRFLEYVASIAPAGRVGAYMGLANLPWFLAKFTTGLYSGSMIAHFMPKEADMAAKAAGSSEMWLIYAIIACISPVLLIVFRKWLMGETKKAG